MIVKKINSQNLTNKVSSENPDDSRIEWCEVCQQATIHNKIQQPHKVLVSKFDKF